VTAAPALALYSLAILLGALAGGALPLLGGRRRSDGMLSFSAGVMLGAAFFHMLPEATEGAGLRAIPWVLVGFLLLFLLERYVLVHVCAEPGVAPEAALDAHHGHAHAVEEHGATGCEVHTLGLAAFVGMSLHTIVDGFALGAASGDGRLGLLVFLAILAHKVPSSFSLSAILRAEGYSRARALAMNAIFALMVPLGAGLYVLLRELVDAESFTSFALAASAGTFLHLALSDIIPDLHRRASSRLQLSGLLLVGVSAMWALRLFHAH
jgi:zinc and cadmium transporter